MDSLRKSTVFAITKSTAVAVMIYYFKQAHGISWTEIFKFLDCTENEECRQKLYTLMVEIITGATLLIPRQGKALELVLRTILLLEFQWINISIHQLSNDVADKPQEQYKMVAAAISYTILSGLILFEFGLRRPLKIRNLLLYPDLYVAYGTHICIVVNISLLLATYYGLFKMSLYGVWTLGVACLSYGIYKFINRKELHEVAKLQVLQNLAAGEIILALIVPMYWYLPFMPHLFTATFTLYVVFRFISMYGSKAVTKAAACALETFIWHFFIMTVLGFIQWVINFLMLAINTVYYSAMLALFIGFLIVQMAFVTRSPYAALAILRYLRDQQAQQQQPQQQNQQQQPQQQNQRQQPQAQQQPQQQETPHQTQQQQTPEQLLSEQFWRSIRPSSTGPNQQGSERARIADRAGQLLQALRQNRNQNQNYNEMWHLDTLLEFLQAQGESESSEEED